MTYLATLSDAGERGEGEGGRRHCPRLLFTRIFAAGGNMKVISILLFFIFKLRDIFVLIRGK